MRKSTKKAQQEPGVSKFDGFGVDFKCKLIGITNVSASRGDDICQTAMNELKAQALKNNKEKKEHKQRITVNITLKGIRLLDESTERIDHAHPIHRISFISHDNDDKRTFAYIVGTKDGYKLFAIKSMKEADEITATLKELFQEVYEIYKAKKKEDAMKEPPPPPPPDTQQNGQAEQQNRGTEQTPEQNGKIIDLASEATYQTPKDAFGNWEQLNEQIQTMQSDNDATSSSFDYFGDLNTIATTSIQDPFGGDNFGSNMPQQQQQTQDANPFDDMYATVDKPKKTTTTPPKTNETDLFTAPAVPDRPSIEPKTDTSSDLMASDPFAELKKNINHLHQQQSQMQQQQQQQMFGFSGNGFQHQPPTMMMSSQKHMANGLNSNPFTSQFTNQNMVYQQPQANPVIPPRPVANNPFAQTPAPTPTFENQGWTIGAPLTPLQPTVTSPVVNNNNGNDPFAFLDKQTSNGNTSSQQQQPKLTAATTTTVTSSDNLLDFLG